MLPFGYYRTTQAMQEGAAYVKSWTTPPISLSEKTAEPLEILNDAKAERKQTVLELISSITIRIFCCDQ